MLTQPGTLMVMQITAPLFPFGLVFATARMHFEVVTEKSATSPAWPSAQLEGDHVEMVKCLSSAPENSRALAAQL